MSNSTDVFLSHDWGVNDQNHVKVRIINKKLIDRGYRTWFDEQQVYKSKPNFHL